MTNTPTTSSPAIEVIRSTAWGVELASDDAWIIRSPRQDLFALPAEALATAALLMAAEPYAIDIVVAQLAQIPGALRLNPAPVAYPELNLPDELSYGHHRGARRSMRRSTSGTPFQGAARSIGTSRSARS